MLSMTCNTNFINRDFIITCESDGRWSPDPENSPCAIGRCKLKILNNEFRFMHLLGPTTAIRRDLISEMPSESVLTTETSPPSKLNITLIVIPLCILALCTVVGFAGICILLKLNLILKQRKERSIANEVNQPCYEVIDPIYEAIPSTAAESTPDYFGIATMSNDAYTHSQEKKCRHSPPADFNASSNEAYVPQ